MIQVFHLKQDNGNAIRFRVQPKDDLVRIDYTILGKAQSDIYIHELGGKEGNTFFVSCGVAITIELARDLWRYFVSHGWNAENIHENAPQSSM